jgi:3-oxoacyl-[acyl-carrier protein] reductase
MSPNGFFNVTQPLLMPMIRTRWGDFQHRVGGRAVGQLRIGQLCGGERADGAGKALSLEVARRGITVNAAPGITTAIPTVSTPRGSGAGAAMQACPPL